VSVKDVNGYPDQALSIVDYYLYNADGQRILKESAETIKYYYTGDAVLFTTDINNIKISENILTLGGEAISSKRFGDVQDGDAWYYFNYDMRGSTTVILKPDGGYKKDYAYDTFGNTIEGGGSFYNETQFTGATYDKSTGMHYMNARYYNPATGRFLTQDSYTGNPYDPWTQNLYAYCGNNPVNFTDPTGHFFRPPGMPSDAYEQYKRYLEEQEARKGGCIEGNPNLRYGDEYMNGPITLQDIVDCIANSPDYAEAYIDWCLIADKMDAVCDVTYYIEHYSIGCNPELGMGLYIMQSEWRKGMRDKEDNAILAAITGITGQLVPFFGEFVSIMDIAKPYSFPGWEMKYWGYMQGTYTTAVFVADVTFSNSLGKTTLKYRGSVIMGTPVTLTDGVTVPNPINFVQLYR